MLAVKLVVSCVLTALLILHLTDHRRYPDTPMAFMVDHILVFGVTVALIWVWMWGPR